jgi:hypothetical protein
VDLGEARSLECFCHTHECPGTLAEALKVGAKVGLYSSHQPWMNEERGCGLIVIAYRYGMGDGVNLVFDAATEKLVGGGTWSDVGTNQCIKPNGNQFGAAGGGVTVDGYLGLALAYPDPAMAQCPGATKCVLSFADSGVDFTIGLMPCGDAGSPDGSAPP